MKKTQIFNLLTFALGAIGIALWLCLPGMKYTVSLFGVSQSTTESGARMIFGIEGWDFAYLLFIGFLCAAFGTVYALICMLSKKAKKLPIVSIAMFVVAAVFCFLTTKCCIINGKFGLPDMYIGSYSLGIGAIIGGVLFACAGVTSALPMFIKD